MDSLLGIWYLTICYIPPSFIVKKYDAYLSTKLLATKKQFMVQSFFIGPSMNVTTVSYVQKLLHCINIYLDFRNRKRKEWK
jgi:hypothetical protein